MGVGSGGQGGAVPLPWIFKHGTNIVDRGLKVLFFGLFLLFFFPLAPRTKFSADALVQMQQSLVSKIYCNTAHYFERFQKRYCHLNQANTFLSFDNHS